ncbi:hypothetical protein AMAG_02535 [Allomyces macrogynus ATCC 38327]|uniref:C2 NT-type domain-containing protein n=1 Tax=Allomyces macrogynus (strain ATCC 38327) TaxID=578462 RepID=A0A0L0S2J0_ALLM3|nr:hypothetical protein AMAG_02535 [Allomyces macrogynus ATCC 38327]|eukprot:KNE56758.1 hypothetical protein AMAG_02535 [Allomyces macrogynus ATCC 38327]
MKIPLFTSKSRQLTFAATVTIHSLDQVPMLSGTFYAKLKLSRTNTSWPTANATNSSASNTALDHLAPAPLGPAPPHSGAGLHYAGQSSTSTTPTTSSPRTQLRDHSVRWDWTCAFDVHMVKDDDGMLEPMPMTVVVKQYKAEENATERVGVVKLDLAPFAGARSTTRRFLLQESKINSTVKVTIAMNLIKGVPMFKVPDLSPDLQIDLSRIAKGMMTSTSGMQNAAANITDAYSLRENDATKRVPPARHVHVRSRRRRREQRQIDRAVHHDAGPVRRPDHRLVVRHDSTQRRAVTRIRHARPSRPRAHRRPARSQRGPAVPR